MQMRIANLLLVSSLLLGLFPSPCFADKRLTVANHGLRFLGLNTEEQTQFRASLGRALEQHQGLSLVGSADEGAVHCGRQIHCHCRAARKAKAARVIFGNIGRIGHIFTFELVLVESQSCEVENSVFFSETHSLASAQDRIRSLVHRLTTPLDTLTETVVKEEREIDAVPAVVTVFTAKQIRQLGIQKFEELLHLVPGFEALDANWGTSVLHQGLPGTILYLVDGVPLSNPMFNFAALHQDFLISLNHLQRVEFIRGPGSVLWGANAYLGIINFITNTPTETSPRVTAQATYGTLGTGDFHVSLGQSHRWFKYYLSTTINLSHGPPSFVANSIFGDVLSDGDLVWGNGGATDNQSDFYYDIVAKLEVIRRLTFMVSIIDHRDDFQISPYGSLLTPDSNGTWHKWHHLYSLTWEDNLPRGFRYRISGSRYEYRFWENFALHPPNEEVLPDGLRALQGNEVTPQVSHLAEARLYHTYNGSFWTNKLLLGGSFLHQKMPNNYADITGITTPVTIPTLDMAAQSFQTFSGFFQEEFSLWRKLFLSGGLRLEHRNPYNLVLNSQAAIMVRTRHLNGKVIYAEGFRPPEANQLFSTVGVEGNALLRPEMSRAVALELGRGLGPFQLKVGGTVAWLYDQIHQTQDPAQVSPGFTSKPINSGSTAITSGYGEVRVNWAPLVSGFVNYNFKHITESEPVGSGIAVAPHTASLGLSVRPLNDLSFFCTGSMISPRTVTALMPDGSSIQRELGAVFNLSLGLWLANLLNTFDVGVKVQNPFGFRHDTPYSVVGNPNYLIEHRRVNEVLFTLRYSSALELAGSARAGISVPSQAAGSAAAVP